jgi:hypothetical protein
VEIHCESGRKRCQIKPVVRVEIARRMSKEMERLLWKTAVGILYAK